MSKREVHILAYFSLPTDLAGAMRDWPEYKSGHGYSVNLQSGEEVVSVEKGDDELSYVSVVGSGTGDLFDRVLGRVVHALGAHSDYLAIYRRDAI